MRYIKFVIFTVVVFYLAYFATLNVERVHLTFLDESLLGASYSPLVFNLRFFVYIFIAVLGTMIVMSALGIIERTALRLKAKKFEKENKKLRAELETLKGLGDRPGRPAGDAGTGTPKGGEKGKRTPGGKKKTDEAVGEGSGRK